MGGMGSGGHNHSGAGTVEETPQLTIVALRKRGGLRPGASTTWRWSIGEQTIASIGVVGGEASVTLHYGVRGEADAPVSISERETLVQWPCRFGGARSLFVCPRCAAAALALFLRGARFMCRHCARLSYCSRREGARDRHLRAADKLRRRLGGPRGALNGTPARPRGMWRRTYQRIIGELERREDIALAQLADWMLTRGWSSRR
jgi:hypothetical protein